MLPHNAVPIHSPLARVGIGRSAATLQQEGCCIPLGACSGTRAETYPARALRKVRYGPLLYGAQLGQGIGELIHDNHGHMNNK